MKHRITASAILLVLFSLYSNMSAQNSTSAYPAYSGMFNERGFTKSNGGTFNGSELVTNFNGNLIYKKTLFEIPGKGDLNIKVELIYNGSVSHFSANAFFNNPRQYIYFLGLPEWILSVNGIAVQVFNFENAAYNKDNEHSGDISNWTASGDEVSTLVNGYHSCGTIGNISLPDGQDVVRILMGDGSVEEFFRDLTAPGEGGSWFGTYHAASAGNFDLGIIHSGNSVGNRTFYLKRGDGTTISYQEYIPPYADGLEQSIYSNDHKPKVFHPTYIDDRFNNIISFSYDELANNFGRYILKSIQLNDKIITVDIIGSLDGDEKYNFNKAVITYSGQTYELIPENNYQTSDRYMIKEIKDPVGRSTFFEYKEENNDNYYLRKAERLLYSDSQNCFDTNDESPPVQVQIYIPRKLEVLTQRINKIKYPDGGESVFKYVNLEAEDNSDGIEFEVPWGEGLPIPPENRPLIQSRAFKNWGRDPFFTNIVKEKKTYKGPSDNSNNLIRTEAYTYEWFHNREPEYIGSYPKYFYDVDSCDQFTTYFAITSPQENDLTTKEYNYRMYPYEKIAERSNGENAYIVDTNYETKLIEERDTSSDHDYLQITYTYDNNNALASMLMRGKNVTACHDGECGIYKYNYAYTYSRKNDNKYAISILTKTVTNPLGVLTKIADIDQDGLTRFKDTSLLTGSLYLNQIVDYEEIWKGSTLFSKVDYNYFPDDNNEDGYLWQLKEELIYPNVNGTPYKISYKYGKNCNWNGHLVAVRDPYWTISDDNFHVTKYDYTITGSTQINYKKRMKDTEETCIETVNNGYSFHIREKVFPSSNFALITDKNIDLLGNLVTAVNSVIDNGNVGYGNKYQYDLLNRIEKIILPYDFNNDPINNFTQKYNYDDNPISVDGDEVSTEITQRLNTETSNFIRTHYNFDGLLQLTSIDRLKLSDEKLTSSMTYNYMGNKKTETNANNHTITYNYENFQQRLDFIEYPLNQKIMFDYKYYKKNEELTNYPFEWYTDANNDYVFVKITTDENGHITKKYYDAIDQLRTIENIVNGQSIYTHFGYNNLGKVTKVKDPKSYETTYTFDDLGRMESKNSGDMGTINYLYDKNSNLRFVKDAKGAGEGYFIYYKYDGINRKIQEGIITNISYFTEVNAENPDFPSGGSEFTVKIEYKYDVDPQWAGITGGENLYGRLSGVKYKDQNSDNWGYTIYSYDARGRVKWLKQSLPGTDIGIKKIDYEYNSADLTAKISYNQGNDDQFYIWYDYNEFGQPANTYAAITDVKPTATVAKYWYWPEGQVKRSVLGNDIQGVDYVYNEREWLTQINHQSLNATYDPGHDGPGGSGVAINDKFAEIIGYWNRDHIAAEGTGFPFTPQYNGNISWVITNTESASPYMTGYTFKYDEINRLKEADYGYWSNPSWLQKPSNGYDVRDIGYDANGNFQLLKRYSETGAVTTLDYEYYSGCNRLRNTIGSGTFNNYSYDFNGNLKGDLDREITVVCYDYRNLPFVINRQDGSWLKYGYDATGNRVTKKFSSGTK